MRNGFIYRGNKRKPSIQRNISMEKILSAHVVPIAIECLPHRQRELSIVLMQIILIVIVFIFAALVFLLVVIAFCVWSGNVWQIVFVRDRRYRVLLQAKALVKINPSAIDVLHFVYIVTRLLRSPAASRQWKAISSQWAWCVKTRNSLLALLAAVTFASAFSFTNARRHCSLLTFMSVTICLTHLLVRRRL